MKKIMLVVIMATFSLAIRAQTLEAKYRVSTEVFIDIDKKATKVADVISSAMLIRDRNRYIYFEEPTYLQNYPDGNLVVKKEAGNYSYTLPADSLLYINFHDLDSMIRIYRQVRSGKGLVDFNIISKVGHIKFSFDYLPDTKEINGLFCQKAIVKISGYTQWIVWFAPSIPMDVGLGNIVGLPGLIVEAEMIPRKTKFYLERYEMGAAVNEKLFHPKEFEQRYETPSGVAAKRPTIGYKN